MKIHDSASDTFGHLENIAQVDAVQMFVDIICVGQSETDLKSTPVQHGH